MTNVCLLCIRSYYNLHYLPKKRRLGLEIFSNSTENFDKLSLIRIVLLIPLMPTVVGLGYLSKIPKELWWAVEFTTLLFQLSFFVPYTIIFFSISYTLLRALNIFFKDTFRSNRLSVSQYRQVSNIQRPILTLCSVALVDQVFFRTIGQDVFEYRLDSTVFLLSGLLLFFTLYRKFSHVKVGITELSIAFTNPFFVVVLILLSYKLGSHLFERRLDLIQNLVIDGSTIRASVVNHSSDYIVLAQRNRGEVSFAALQKERLNFSYPSVCSSAFQLSFGELTCSESTFLNFD